MSLSVGRSASIQASSRNAEIQGSAIHITDPDRSQRDERRQQRQFDIIGSLPLELIIQVTHNLNATDVVRSRRVSKRWRAIFSSQPITTHVLRETITSLGLHPKDMEHSEHRPDVLFRMAT
ncbi:hypothetical protein VTN31DRAFT_3455 [Thermomyces dupontii]|uniref:uncharacterized protein n=1 Tax=Talaromyces thermophilus TaxID=28565 RepID=UPI00374338EE